MLCLGHIRDKFTHIPCLPDYFDTAATAADDTIFVEIDVSLLDSDAVVAGTDYIFGVSVEIDGSSLYSNNIALTALAADIATEVGRWGDRVDRAAMFIILTLSS